MSERIPAQRMKRPRWGGRKTDLARAWDFPADTAQASRAETGRLSVRASAPSRKDPCQNVANRAVTRSSASRGSNWAVSSPCSRKMQV